MKKEKKTIIAAVAVFLCLCLTVASVIWLKKGRENPPAKTGGQTKTAESTTEAPSETETKSTTKVQSETQPTTEKETKPQTTKKPETTTKKPKPSTTSAPSTSKKPSVTEKPVDVNYYPDTHEIEGSLPKKNAVPGSYFNDTVFVGDSVSVKLSYYEASADVLGKAQFLVAGSLSATNALWDVSDRSVHPKYNGKKQKVEDSIAQMNVKKVYIMLGMNDINMAGINGGIKNFETLCNRILEKSPNVQIFVQSVTPMASSSNVASSKEGRLSNKSIYEYNKKLAALAARRGWYFVNVSSVMYDDKGYLRNEYCSDLNSMGIHFTNSGCKAWVDYLLTHTP